MAGRYTLTYRSLMKRQDNLLDIDKVLLHLTIVPLILIFSRLYVFIDVLTPLFLLSILVVALAAVQLFVRAQFHVLAFGVLAVVGFALAMLRFSAVANIPFNVKALSQFTGLMAIFVTYRFTSQGRTPDLVRILFWYAFAYACIYILVNAALKFDIYHPRGSHQALVLKDWSRRPRLYLANGIISFGLAVTAARLRQRVNMKNLVLLGIFAVAIAAALSRTFTVVVGCVTLAYLVLRNAKLVSWGALAAFLAISAVLVIGLAFPTFTPFSGDDGSAHVRASEYEIARHYIRQWPILGIGFPSVNRSYQEFLAVDAFAASDLGLVGIWLTFGLVGMLLFVASAVVCATAYRDRYDQVTRDALALTGAMLTAYAVIAPTMWYSEATLLLALLVGERLFNGVPTRVGRPNQQSRTLQIAKPL